MLNLILWLVVGAVTGWLAGYGVCSRASTPRNIVLGIVGALIGGFLVDYTMGNQNMVNPIALLVAYFSAAVLLVFDKLLQMGRIRPQ